MPLKCVFLIHYHWCSNRYKMECSKLLSWRRRTAMVFIVTCCYLLYSLLHNNNEYHQLKGNNNIILNTTITEVATASNLQNNVKVPKCQVDMSGSYCVKPYFVPERVDCLKYKSPSMTLLELGIYLKTSCTNLIRNLQMLFWTESFLV